MKGTPSIIHWDDRLRAEIARFTFQRGLADRESVDALSRMIERRAEKLTRYLTTRKVGW